MFSIIEACNFCSNGRIFLQLQPFTLMYGTCAQNSNYRLQSTRPDSNDTSEFQCIHPSPQSRNHRRHGRYVTSPRTRKAGCVAVLSDAAENIVRFVSQFESDFVHPDFAKNRMSLSSQSLRRGLVAGAIYNRTASPADREAAFETSAQP